MWKCVVLGSCFGSYELSQYRDQNAVLSLLVQFAQDGDCLPNTKPGEIQSGYCQLCAQAKRNRGSCIHVLQVGAVTRGQQGKSLRILKEWLRQGKSGISETAKSVMDAASYLDGMLEAVLPGIPVLAHCCQAMRNLVNISTHVSLNCYKKVRKKEASVLSFSGVSRELLQQRWC